ncbi:hypothetical protein AcV5_005539 [Taiwanofungus camphoratus]|nr:hypothetical protein AcV5_005539 [Antrodia cinnamomea]
MGLYIILNQVPESYRQHSSFYRGSLTAVLLISSTGARCNCFIKSGINGLPHNDPVADHVKTAITVRLISASLFPPLSRCRTRTAQAVTRYHHDFRNIFQLRVWFVAGSSQGLGKALVEVLLAADERVVATLRKPEALGSLSKKHPASQVLVLPLDVTNEAQISEAFEMTRERFGRLDVVVNNAGYCVEGEIEAVPEEVARKEMDVLFWGLVHITKQAIKT